MEISREISIKTEEETKEFGKTLSDSLMPGDVIALIGDLGTGKTTLTKYIAEGLGVIENVNSPTFVIVKSYDGRLPL
ncbi:MAG: tRNA (adenosine(37)-N6)-threonylcarbamoyltransferase complex ATPase subunit type 1 TsaE, partial [Clostridia bacterium]|nr:tRNA (adenosine(37)-N6)-threonylcarbamoyltransferase complex ATPase subunit type 1 TsaE [Clostridia bacterium]